MKKSTRQKQGKEHRMELSKPHGERFFGEPPKTPVAEAVATVKRHEKLRGIQPTSGTDELEPEGR